MSSKASLPKVQTTAVFAEALTAAGLDPLEFADAFAAWKQDWPKWVDLDYYFGKDGEYVDRARGGARTSVMHVHMAPDDPAQWPADRPPLSPEQYKKIEKELTAWNKLWAITEQNERRGKRLGIPWHPTSARYRTSSRVLVYVDGKRHGYLLLHLGFEPEGHDEATANIQLLRHWEEVARAFIHDGSVII